MLHARWIPSQLTALALLVATGADATAQCEALQFDGVNDRATIPDVNGDFDFMEMTVEAWIRVDAPVSAGTAVGGHIEPLGIAWGLEGGISSPDTAVWLVSVPNTDAVTSPGMWPDDGVWRHYAGTYDGTDMELFVNGVSVAQGPHGTGGTPSPVDAVHLGQRSSSSVFFEGALDEVRIWDVVRTAAEIQATYMQPLVGDEPGLIGYYKFDEGGGDVIVDSSLAGNDGFLGALPGPGTDDPARIPNGLPFNPCASSGTPFCFGDGSGIACPCGNTGGAGEGCANSSGAGAVLSGSGAPSISNDTLVLTASNVLPAQPGLFFQGENAINGGMGTPFGDGLRCCGTNVIRLSTIVPDASGCAASDASCGTDLMAPVPAGPISQHPQNSVGAGDTRCYQFWYRDPLPNAPCGSTFNLTNALEVTWEM